MAQMNPLRGYSASGPGIAYTAAEFEVMRRIIFNPSTKWYQMYRQWINEESKTSYDSLENLEKRALYKAMDTLKQHNKKEIVRLVQLLNNPIAIESVETVPRKRKADELGEEVLSEPDIGYNRREGHRMPHFREAKRNALEAGLDPDELFSTLDVTPPGPAPRRPGRPEDIEPYQEAVAQHNARTERHRRSVEILEHMHREPRSVAERANLKRWRVVNLPSLVTEERDPEMEEM